MNQESINKALDLIINAISNSDIDRLDKYELLMNINYFLTNYETITKSKVDNTSFKPPNEPVDDRKPHR